ncbi:MAG TPA: hypothetical protein VNO50_08355 [Pyrinomonadaceae bacterium]|nr:hypothetical protein [Pyrinomonadaceae bacterium]
MHPISENLYQPDTPTITCPSCGETLLYGVKSCRFCRHAIDPTYARKSVTSQAILTHAVKSANTVRTLRNLLYLQLGLTILAFLWDPPYLQLILIVSIINLAGPIRWLRKYGRGDLDHPEILKAQKDMKIELYCWLGAIIIQATAIIVWLVRL